MNQSYRYEGMHSEELVYDFNKDIDPVILKSLTPDIVGNKGASLAHMCAIGIPVPDGFIISSHAFHEYQKNKKLSSSIKDQITSSIKLMEENLGLGFGNIKAPLILSVRSGACVSMPGMMDTILNLGLNDDTVIGLAKRSRDERFALDSYRRFIQMYSSIVLGVEISKFEDLLNKKRIEVGVLNDSDLSISDLYCLIREYKEMVKDHYGSDFPQDVVKQLWGAVCAVFDSWNNKRAVHYRKMYSISDTCGTAVNVQSMVFGNLGNNSATGVCFSRNPSTGAKEFFGEYLINAQGEDVVSGIRTPRQIVRGKDYSSEVSMEEEMPELFAQLNQIQSKLESYYKDMQDIEFTIENGKMWILQSRAGKRTAYAAVEIAVDMVHEGLITEEEAIMRIDPKSLEQMLHPVIDSTANKEVLCVGLPASPGGASGKVCFSTRRVEEYLKSGQSAILVRKETSPDDIEGMDRAFGILTSRGGMTSHAAVIARGMGKACVVGACDISIDYAEAVMTIGSHVIKEGEVITIDGSTGEVVKGSIPMIQPKLSDQFKELIAWSDRMKIMDVRANAETTKDVNNALNFGAQGIGLCRTEHMFFGDRIDAMQEMILSTTKDEREKAIAKLLPYQRSDFISLFKIMHGLPVNIRLLDPPLHEFLPSCDAQVEALAKRMQISQDIIKSRVNAIKETNPMLGHRGCRLAITYPEIYNMQVTAILKL